MISFLAAFCLAVSAISVSDALYPVPKNEKEAAAQFWKERVKASGHYDFRLENVRSEVSPETLEPLPDVAVRELRSLVEECIGKVEAFEDRVTDLLAETYTREELVMLRDLLQSEIGRSWLVERKALDEDALSDFEGTPSQEKLARDAIESGLVARYDGKRGEFFTTINEWVDPVIEYRDRTFPKLVFEAQEPYLSGMLFRSSLAQTESSSVLRLMVEPMSCVNAYLDRQGWGELGLELDEEGEGKRIGDRALVLLSFGKGELDAQWILKVEWVEKTGPEAARSGKSVVTNRYTTFGGSYAFDSDVEAFSVQMIGPFKPKNDNDAEFEPKVSDFRILLQGDRLELGLHDAAAFITRFRYFLEEHEVNATGLVIGGGRPFSEEQIARTRTELSELAVTPEEDRAYAGSLLAYWEFFQVVARTPELRSILFKVAELSPLSYFKYRKHGISVTNVSFAFDRLKPIEELGERPVFTYPIRFTIASKPVLLARLIVTEPVAPLRNVAGIYGFVASSPEDPAKRVVMRVLSATRGVSPSGE